MVDLRMICATIALSFVICAGIIWSTLTFAYSHNGISDPGTRALHGTASLIGISISAWTVIILIAALIERAALHYRKRHSPLVVPEPETSEDDIRRADR
jgi:presenilin-like A22 family membrane protease